MVNRHLILNEADVELSDKSFKVTVIKILHQAIVKIAETKYRKSQQIKRRHKEESNGF